MADIGDIKPQKGILLLNADLSIHAATTITAGVATATARYQAVHFALWQYYCNNTTLNKSTMC